MVNIVIKKDNFGYITTEDKRLFDLIIKSFKRKVTKFNTFYHKYITTNQNYYSLINKDTVIKVKAGLIKPLCNSFDVKHIPYSVKDERNKLVYSDNFIFIDKLNDKVTLKNYQKEALIEIYQNPFCTIQLGTGTGKTEVASAIFKNYLTLFPQATVLYVVTTLVLQKDAENRFKNYGIPVSLNYPFTQGCVNIITYKSLIRKDIPLKDRNTISCIVFDEAHHLKAEKSSRIVHKYNNLNMCVGLSATITNDIEKDFSLLKRLNESDLVIFGSTGLPVYYKTVKDSLEDNAILPVKINLIHNPKYYHDYKNDWHKIRKEILMSEKRTDFVVEKIKEISKNYNTLCVLVPEIEWSNNIMLKLNNIIEDKSIKLILTYGGGIYKQIINGELVELNEQQKEQAIKDIKNPEVKTIFSATVYFFEGANIPNIQALINVYGGQSYIRVKQQLGRAMRHFDNKNVANIYEFYDNNATLINQLNKRLSIYSEEYDAEIVDYN